MKQLIQLFTRAAVGISFLVPGLDRFGVWGPNGAPGVSWGDWQHFMNYARNLLFFLPYSIAEVAAFMASMGEILFGLLLLIGWKIRLTALGAGFLLLSFALCMWMALGIVAPLGYSVFTASGACFLLSTYPSYRWSLDAWIARSTPALQPAAN